MDTKKQAIAELLSDIKIEFKFVPFSLSKNKSETHKTINYILTLSNGKFSFQCDYSMGIGHVFDRKNKPAGSLSDKQINVIVETGSCWFDFYGENRPNCANQKIPLYAGIPDIVDVFYSLIVDVSSINMSFPEFCAEYGFNDDSIKDKELYEQCLENSRNVKKLLPAETIEKLKEEYLEY